MNDEERLLVEISSSKQAIDDDVMLMNGKISEYLILKGWKITPLIFGCYNYESSTGKVVGDLDKAFKIEMSKRSDVK